MTPDLTHDALLDALLEVAEVMSSRGEQGRLYVVGGAAMMLAHSVDRVTADVDASIQRGYAAVMGAARVVAERRGWPRTWLNEGATSFMPEPQMRHGKVILDHPALKVIAATGEHMLAMKVRAARATDVGDVEALLSECGCSTVVDVEELVGAVFAGEELQPRQRQWVEMVLERTAQIDDGLSL